MSKVKFIILSFLSIICLCITTISHAETTAVTNYEIISELVIKDNANGTIYKFNSVELRDYFINNNSKYQTRSAGVADVRRTFVRSIRKTLSSGAISNTAYGGVAGATVTSPLTFNFTDPQTGIGISVNLGTSHNVPPHTYGHIVAKVQYNLNEYNLSVRYIGTNTYVPAGKAYDISNVFGWTELRTWK